MTREEAILAMQNIAALSLHPDEREAAEIAIEALKEHNPDWISVKDKLPENGDAVIVYSDNIHDKVDTDEYYTDGGFYGWGGAVTRWMPMPKPPKMERKEDEKE